MEQQKNPNTITLLIIVGAILLIVAMVCGVFVWMAQRTFDLQEKMLESNRAETVTEGQPVAPAPASTPVAPEVKPAPPVSAPATSVPQPAPKVQPAPELAASAPVASQPAPKAERPAPKPAPKAQPAAPAQPAQQNQVKPQAAAPQKSPAPVTAKRKAPQETPAAKGKVGPDGLPLNRVTLPVGNDDLEWQL